MVREELGGDAGVLTLVYLMQTQLIGCLIMQL